MAQGGATDFLLRALYSGVVYESSTHVLGRQSKMIFIDVCYWSLRLMVGLEPDLPNMLKTPKIVFVTGKGGVGKSLVAAGVAHVFSEQKQRVLLVEVGDSSYYQILFSTAQIGMKPQALALGFDVALWSGPTCLRDYVLHFLRLGPLYDLFFENKVMQALINVAPGLNEIAILGKLTSKIRNVGPEIEYDVIVVDCFASGHAMSLLRAPKGLMQAVPFGPMGSHSRDIDAILRDSKLTAYLVVALLEELPVTEALELCSFVKNELGVDPYLVVNKRLVPPVAKVQLASLKDKSDQPGWRDFYEFILKTLKRQTAFSDRLEQSPFKIIGQCPQVFSSDPNELAKEIGENLRKNLTTS